MTTSVAVIPHLVAQIKDANSITAPVQGIDLLEGNWILL
jgi:hypothetical protein